MKIKFIRFFFDRQILKERMSFNYEEENKISIAMHKGGEILVLFFTKHF